MDEPRDALAAERRMAAVGGVEQVMRAVWALARAQQPAVEQAAAEASTFLAWTEELVDRLAGAPEPSAGADTLYVLVGPERPFCGSLPRVLLDQAPADGVLGLVGSRLAESAVERPELAARVRFTLPAAATPEELGPRAEAVAGAMLAAGGGRDLVLLHPTDGTSAVVRSVLVAGRRAPAAAPPECFGALQEVLEAAVHESVEGRLAVALAEALRSEVRGRLVAAEAARRACEREIDELGREWRALRQSAITAELLDLVGASRAREREP